MGEQVTGVCPGIPGYCSLDLPGAVCEFACPIGDPIRSECTEDGTWEPYPTCDGDPRETQEGCNPCPGPNGAPRNRTTETGPRNTGTNRGNNGENRSGNGGQRQNSGGNRSGNGGSRRNNGGNEIVEFSPPPRKSPVQKEFQEPRSFPTPKSNRRNNNNEIPSSNNNNSNNRGGDSSGQCPGDQLEACIDVCPGFSARIFGACVAGCAKRCPAKK